MAILWCGGEDIDFPNGTAPSVTTNNTYYNSIFSRCGLYSTAPGNFAQSVTMSPAVTSAWVSSYIYVPNTAYISTNTGFFGFCKNGGNKGIYWGVGSAINKLAIIRHTGSAWNVIASESGNTFSVNGFHKVDMQIINYGASGTVNLYLDNNLLVTYTGDISISGVTDLDCAALHCSYWYGGAGPASTITFSQIIIADEDTRTFTLATNYPNAAGDTLDWTGAYTTVDEEVINDSDVAYTDTNDQYALYNLSATPAGSFTVKACKIAARATRTAGSTPTSLKLGVKSGSTTDVDAGQSLTTGWATYERLMTVNPVTSSAFTTSEIDSLQVAMESAA